jgi:hypothetical protein
MKNEKTPANREDLARQRMGVENVLSLIFAPIFLPLRARKGRLQERAGWPQIDLIELNCT